jgi:hypothetical protein
MSVITEKMFKHINMYAYTYAGLWILKDADYILNNKWLKKKEY